MNCLNGLGSMTSGLGAVLLAAVWVNPIAASGTASAERSDASAEMVDRALFQEIEGNNDTRGKLLLSALEQSPDYAPARWHSGQVKLQNEWIKFDEVPDRLADDTRVAQYERRRLDCPDTVAGHLALARWCGQRKLVDRQRAHLTRVLEIDPEHAEARQHLGYQKVYGVWMSRQEIAEAAARAEQVGRALAEWKPKLEKILVDLQHRSQKVRDTAKQRLLAIDDPAAIPAMELVLSCYNQETALLMIQVLDKISATDASAALARQAVFCPWDLIRHAAAAALKTRDPAAYVPMLLSAMSSPIQTRAELYRAPGGRLRYRHAFYREGQQRAELAVFQTDYQQTLLSPGDQASYMQRRLMLDEARRRDAVLKAQALDAAAAIQNVTIQRVNERIAWVLSTATGLNLPQTAEDWWNWWNQYNEVYVTGQKPIQQIGQRETVAFDDPDPMSTEEFKELTKPRELPKPFEGGSLRDVLHEGDLPYHKKAYVGTEVWKDKRGYHWAKYPSGWWKRLCCLLAGTLVWTDSGPVPIEQIQIGDMVLSQDPVTGELAYKPVLNTTARPPARLLKMVIGDQSLQCSGGHMFWVTGAGWVKARDLKEGMRLHAVDGVKDLRSVHPTGAEQTYNLVVADFHTFFATEDRLLTHDNTIRDPVDRIVPGLARR